MLWKFLKDNMEQNLNQTVCDENTEMIYSELITFAESFSKNLKGIKCCAILCRSELEAAKALLACFAAGVTAVPLSQRYGELHCNKILDTINPDAVITDENGKLKVNYIRNSSFSKPNSHPALIMCTSGTTGVPKGAMLTEKNIVTNVSDIANYFNIGYKDTILIARPLYHCAVLTGEFLTALIKGAKIRFYSGTFNPAVVLKIIEDFNITAFCGTPTLLSMMARFKRNDNMLRHICISGECMGYGTGKRIADAFSNADIYHIYGLTEASPRVAFLPPHNFAEYADCVGVPLKSVSLKILNEAGKPIISNEIGVLWVKGDNVMAGYYNEPEKTKEVLQNGWLCTGDLATFNDFGYLKIKGRNDDLIIKAGMNIYPAEMEGVLKLDKRVRELYVCGKPDEKTGVKIVLTIAGDFKDVSEVKDLCKASLPNYQMPAEIHLVNEIPKNGSGKIIRR